MKINGREFSVKKINAAYLYELVEEGYHVSDWAFDHAKYEVTDIKTGESWFLPWNYKQELKEILNEK